jgi:hypothetical protein
MALASQFQCKRSLIKRASICECHNVTIVGTRQLRGDEADRDIFAHQHDAGKYVRFVLSKKNGISQVIKNSKNFESQRCSDYSVLWIQRPINRNIVF